MTESKPDQEYSTESGRRADPERVIERINGVLEDVGADQAEDGPDRDWEWDDPVHRTMLRSAFDNPDDEEAILPGFGELGEARNARDDCGDNHPFVCNGCGQRVDFGRTCAQSVCARCGPAWCRDLGIKKAAKLRRVRKVEYGATPSDEHPKHHHQIISPNMGWYWSLAQAGYSLQEAQEKTREVVKFILEEMRAQGLLVRHSYRGAGRNGRLRDEKDDMGAWKERQFSKRNWYDDVRQELGWKPHYHAIVVADWLEGDGFTDVIEESTGWVIHRIADDEGYSLETDADMARAVTYCLSHADVEVNLDGHNQSKQWEVGSFYGELEANGRRGGGIANTGTFSPKPSDLDWADGAVRRHAWRILGLNSGTTDCGASLPAVAEPDELARRILEEMYPDDEEERSRISEDAVLENVTAGNIRVSVSTLDGGGGNVTVDGWSGDLQLGASSSPFGSASSLPEARSTGVVSEPAPLELDVDGDDDESTSSSCSDGCDCGDHGADDGLQEGRTCDGTLIPLGEFRARGLLEDPEWRRDAPHVDQARKVDAEEPDDLERWRTESPGRSVAAG